jgi:hypothetical protein
MQRDSRRRGRCRGRRAPCLGGFVALVEVGLLLGRQARDYGSLDTLRGPGPLPGRGGATRPLVSESSQNRLGWSSGGPPFS